MHICTLYLFNGEHEGVEHAGVHLAAGGAHVTLRRRGQPFTWQKERHEAVNTDGSNNVDTFTNVDGGAQQLYATSSFAARFAPDMSSCVSRV